ncbi:MAG: cysteine synthase A [Oscillospiraceae bacterium]|nr:cysteine synthase A [Oscillospiraceae bacterium]
MPVYTDVSQLIGRTPLVELTHLEKELGLCARVLAKAEFFNPAGSVKDRAALCMIEAAEQSGALIPGGLLIEPTSGNTGIGLAMLAAVRGYRAAIVMPDTMSAERIALMKAYGAEVILTPGALGMAGCIEKAQQLCAENPGSLIAGQFTNPANPQAHYETTGPEIWQDTDGCVDIFVAGIGTGGTITGTGRYLKEQDPAVRVVGMEPAASPLLTEGCAGRHRIEGIGANFVPDVLDRSLLDEVVTVSNEDAIATARLLAKKEGLFAGISSGAAAAAALALAKRSENAGKTIVTLLPDAGSRYLSIPDMTE